MRTDTIILKLSKKDRPAFLKQNGVDPAQLVKESIRG